MIETIRPFPKPLAKRFFIFNFLSRLMNKNALRGISHKIGVVHWSQLLQRLFRLRRGSSYQKFFHPYKYLSIQSYY